jgi:hypothetical protein
MDYQANTSETYVYTPQSRRLNSQEVLTLARSWIHKCLGPDHKHCPNGGFRNRVHSQLDRYVDNPSPSDTNGVIKPLTRANTHIEPNPPFYPTRLIELGPVNASTVKLIVTDNPRHPIDQTFKKPQGQYVTLSHCWGKLGAPFCLNAKNLDIFQNIGIPLKELPRTFLDAIDFARRLSSNINYIWIDSLCIIQGDLDDWLLESTQMYKVYRNSYCNISATAAKDSSQGLYAERDPQHLWGEHVDLNTEDMLRVGAGSKRKRDYTVLDAPEALIQRCSIVDPSLWDRKVDTAPVNTRAWVLQERLLAPRVLHFCEDQVAWECRELDASESTPNGIASLELRAGTIRDRVRLKSLVALEYGPRDSLDGEADASYQAHENWKRITERYSLTSLTNAEDKLIALAGIAEQMSTQIGSRVCYVAGMWQNKYFASQLLWRVETQYKNGEFLYPSKRPKEYRAPSFSWAAIDAPQGIRCGETQDDGKLLIEVTTVDVQPKPEPNSKFGLVKEGGFIKVRCQKLPIKIERKPRRTADGYREDVYIWTLTGEREGEDEKMHPNVYLDSPDDDFERIRGWRGSMWLVPAYKNSSGDLVGLLLQLVEVERKKESSYHSNHFRRVGLTVIPRYVSAENAFMDKSRMDEDGHFIGLRKQVIQIV